MNDREQLRYERLLRVRTFGTENTADFPLTSKARVHFTSVDAHILKLEGAKAGQKPGLVSKEALLDELRADLKLISRTARAIALSDPTFSTDDYRLPDNPSEAALLTLADRVLSLFEIIPGEPPATVAAKTALTQRFLAYELPADFVTDLRSDLNAVRAATNQNYGEIQEGTGHTALIGPTLAAAAKDVQELDTIMQNKYARQPDKLRAWLSASRVERTAAKKKEEPPTPPAPAPGQ